MKQNSGFTLIEVMLVLAITSLLLMAVIVGQGQVRERTRFDTSVDRLIQDIAYARNFAMSGVNDSGNGDSTGALVAGVGLELDNQHKDEGHPLEELEPIYAEPDSSGNLDLSTVSLKPPHHEGTCDPARSDESDECWEQYLQNTDLEITGGDYAMVVYFVNNGNGLTIYHETSSGGLDLGTAFSTTGGAPVQIQVTNTAHTLNATIQIDPVSGYGKRLN